MPTTTALRPPVDLDDVVARRVELIAGNVTTCQTVARCTGAAEILRAFKGQGSYAGGGTLGALDLGAHWSRENGGRFEIWTFGPKDFDDETDTRPARIDLAVTTFAEVADFIAPALTTERKVEAAQLLADWRAWCEADAALPAPGPGVQTARGTDEHFAGYARCTRAFRAWEVDLVLAAADLAGPSTVQLGLFG